MSLNVPTALLERAAAGHVADAEFVDCVRHSPPTEAERGQLLRAFQPVGARAARNAAARVGWR